VGECFQKALRDMYYNIGGDS